MPVLKSLTLAGLFGELVEPSVVWAVGSGTDCAECPAPIGTESIAGRVRSKLHRFLVDRDHPEFR